jgi:hypothetical protein
MKISILRIENLLVESHVILPYRATFPAPSLTLSNESTSPINVFCIMRILLPFPSVDRQPLRAFFTSSPRAAGTEVEFEPRRRRCTRCLDGRQRAHIIFLRKMEILTHQVGIILLRRAGHLLHIRHFDTLEPGMNTTGVLPPSRCRLAYTPGRKALGVFGSITSIVICVGELEGRLAQLGLTEKKQGDVATGVRSTVAGTLCRDVRLRKGLADGQ